MYNTFFLHFFVLNQLKKESAQELLKLFNKGDTMYKDIYLI
jgi:hypothetical protein